MDRDPLFTVVSFYTSDYADDAARLIASLEEFNIPKVIRRMPSLGSWSANTAFKPTFLSDMRAKIQGPIVWLDADAIVRSYPVEFDHLADPKKIARHQTDIAVHYRRGEELLSGTIWLGDTSPARGIINDWIAKQIEHPEIWDQKTLAAVLTQYQHRIRLYDLPATYTFIFDLMRRELPHAEPVIEHFQASRRTRRTELIKKNQKFTKGLF